MKVIDRDRALSMPFANCKYDHEHAGEDFINGCETYKEWLETLPVTVVPDEGFVITSDRKESLIYDIAMRCIEKGGYNVDIHADDNGMSVSFYPWCD